MTHTIDTLGPPAATGWWWMADGGTIDEVPPWYMAYWDGERLRVYTPTDNIREYGSLPNTTFCRLGYSEVDPVKWAPVPNVV